MYNNIKLIIGGFIMNITIVGCGKIGTAILSNLINEGHNVVVIDNDKKVISEITNIYDAMTWYMKASLQGNEEATERLNELEAN